MSRTRIPKSLCCHAFAGPVIVYEHDEDTFEFRTLVDDADGAVGGPAYIRPYLGEPVVGDFDGDTPELGEDILHCDPTGTYTDVEPSLFYPTTPVTSWRRTAFFAVNGKVYWAQSPFA